MYNFPFFGLPFYRNYYNRPYYTNKQFSDNSNNTVNEDDKKNSTTNNNSSSTINNNYEPFINILGINLYSDDILILCILLSLYLEGVKDEMLFISLILLLLS